MRSSNGTSRTLADHTLRRLGLGLLTAVLAAGVVGAVAWLVSRRLNPAGGEAIAGRTLPLMVALFVLWSLAVGLWVLFLLRPTLKALDRLELEKSDAAWMNFLASVAHELRTPLALIMSYAELMSDPAARPTEGEVTQWGKILSQEARRMSQLAEAVVTAATVEEHRLDLHPVPLRLGHFLADVVEEARHQTGREIVLEGGPDSTVCAGDALHLRKVFLNLLDNAAKFSPADTPIHVSTLCVQAGNRTEVTVTNFGTGIAEADMPILFRRFGRIKNERTRGIPGSGLGLYVVKQIVERHGGAIAVRSQPGRETSFVVNLPVIRHEATHG